MEAAFYEGEAGRNRNRERPVEDGAAGEDRPPRGKHGSPLRYAFVLTLLKVAVTEVAKVVDVVAVDVVFAVPEMTTATAELSTLGKQAERRW